jgi:hypothetical protein
MSQNTNQILNSIMQQALTGTNNPLAPTYIPNFQNGSNDVIPPTVLPSGGSTQYVDANSVTSNEVDPQLAQLILTKIAGNIPLTQDEKIAVAKLPPSVLAHAQLSGTSPLPNNYSISAGAGEPKTTQAYNGPTPAPRTGAQLAQNQNIPTPPTGMGTNLTTGTMPNITPGGSDMAGYDIPSARINSPAPKPPAQPITPGFKGAPVPPSVLPSNGTIQGTAPINTPPASTSTPPSNVVSPAQPITPGFKNAPGGVSGTTPNVQVAQSVVNSPNTPPNLKNLSGQQIATMIGNILDAVGVGLSARGGVNRQTMLQHQMQLARETAASIAQTKGKSTIAIAQNLADAQNASNIAVNQATAMLPINQRAGYYAALNNILQESDPKVIAARTAVLVAQASAQAQAYQTMWGMQSSNQTTGTNGTTLTPEQIAANHEAEIIAKSKLNYGEGQ